MSKLYNAIATLFVAALVTAGIVCTTWADYAMYKRAHPHADFIDYMWQSN